MKYYWYNMFTKTIEPFEAEGSNLPTTPEEACDQALGHFSKERATLCSQFDELTTHINTLTRIKNNVRH